jgi:hypothetical protein
MFDVARTLALLIALVRAVRHRLHCGALFTGLSLSGMALVAYAAWSALMHHDVNGEHGFAFLYIGPTMLPFGGREWLPTVVQFALTFLSAVPAVAALRSPSGETTGAFLVVFVANAMLAVATALGAFLMWRQETVFAEYWQNPSLVGRPERRKFRRLVLRPGKDEAALASLASQTRVTLLVRNHSGEPIHLVWLDLQGHRSAVSDWELTAAPPGIAIEGPAWARHAFVVTDDAGSAMCTFVVDDGDSVADVDGPCH